MAELATVPRHREAQDLGRARDPATRRRQDVDQRPHARGLLPAGDASHARARRRSRSPRPRAATTSASASTAAASAARQVQCGTASPARSSRPIRSSACRSSARASSPVTHARSSARRPACTRRARRRSSASASRLARAPARAGLAQLVVVDQNPDMGGVVAEGRAAARRYFGTDGVRGVVGETLTAELVERLGAGGDALVRPRARARRARHARLGAGARGRPDARDRRARAAQPFSPACCRRPRSRCSPRISALVVSASHNPPEYNGVKVFDREGHKLSRRRTSSRSRRSSTRRAAKAARSRTRRTRSAGYVDHVLEHFGSDLSRPPDRGRLRERRVLSIAPDVFERLGADVTALAATRPTARTSTTGCGATDLGLLQAAVRAGRLRSRRRVRRRR